MHAFHAATDVSHMWAFAYYLFPVMLQELDWLSTGSEGDIGCRSLVGFIYIVGHRMT